MNKVLSAILTLTIAFSIVSFSAFSAGKDEGVAPDGVDPDAVQKPPTDFQLNSDSEHFKPTELTQEMFDQIFGSLEQNEQGEGIHIYIDGAPVEFPDAKPQIVNDRTMVPVRFIAEQLGAQVNYSTDNGQDTATIKKGDMDIVLIAGDQNARVNGINYVLDVPATIIDDRMMVPFRFIFERFGINVDYQERQNASGQTVSMILATTNK